MALVEIVGGLLAETSAGPLGDLARRQESIVQVAKVVGSDPTQPSRQYETYYVAALVERLSGGPDPVLALFRDQYVKAAFRRAASAAAGGSWNLEMPVGRG